MISKSNSHLRRLSATAMAGLLLLSSTMPAFSQTTPIDKSSDPTQTAKPPATTTPESDTRSAADTVWSIDSKVEKKLGEEQLNPKSGEKTQSVEAILDSLKKAQEEQAKEQGTPPGAEGNKSGFDANKSGADGNSAENKSSVDANKPGTDKPGAPIDPSRVLLRDHPNEPVTLPPSQAAPVTTAPNKTGTTPGAAAAPGAAAKPPGAETMKLFGRIEQIAGDGDVKMPVLKAQTPQLDPRGKLLPAEIEKYSGSIAKSFPSDFRGVWGGQLAVWSYRYSPNYISFDRDEALQTANILKAGRQGSVNFQFYKDQRGLMALEPATVLMSIPMKDSHSFNQMMGSGGMNNQLGPFAGAFMQMAGNMEAPMVQIYFGKKTTDAMEKGISGNEFRQEVAKNVIRELGPGVIEQQIITKFVTRTQGGKSNSGYDESVMRFKKLSDSKLYVLCASVKYSGAGKYLSKLIMYGTVDRGRAMQTNPYANMNKMMGDMMNLGGMQQMFGGSGGQINVPHGGFGGMKMPQGGNGQMLNPQDLFKQMQQMQRQP